VWETPTKRRRRDFRKSTTAAALFSRLEWRLRDDVPPGRGPKHECVFLALGDAAARYVWFFGHEGGPAGENATIVPDRGATVGAAARKATGLTRARLPRV